MGWGEEHVPAPEPEVDFEAVEALMAEATEVVPVTSAAAGAIGPRPAEDEAPQPQAPGATREDVRCAGVLGGRPCNRLLAEQLTSPWRIVCPKCRHVNAG